MADKSLSYLTNCVVKFADDSKYIRSDVKDIRDALCGGKLEKAIISLSENKDGGKASLKPLKSPVLGGKDLKKINDETNKILKQILGKIDGKNRGGKLDIKNLKIDNRDKGSSNILNTISLVEKLKNISLKDLIAGKMKMKPLKKITEKALHIFHMFKDEKELENTMNFIDRAIDISKQLKKVALTSILSNMGVKTIQKLFFGKGKRPGLVGIMEDISKKDNKIEKGKKGIASIHKAILSVLGLCLATIGIGLLAIPAAIGIGITALLITGLTAIFEKVGKKLGKLSKGAIAFTIMSAGLAVFALGLGVLIKATRDLSWKQCGIMLATIGGVGLAMAGIGLLAIPIIAGAGTMLIIGASLGILALSLMVWQTFDAKTAIGNIDLTIHGLKQLFGLEKEGEEDAGFFSKIGNAIGAGIEGLVGAVGAAGQFAEIAAIAAGVVMMDVIRLALIPWETYDSTKAVENIKKNMAYIKNAFFPPVTNEGGVIGWLKNAGGKLVQGLSGICGAVAGAGEFAELATISAGILTMDLIRVALIPWETYDATKAIDNIKKNMAYIKNAFFPPVTNEGGVIGWLKNAGGKIAQGLSGVCGAVAGAGEFAELATISAGILTMDLIRVALIPWEKYDAKPAIDNIQATMASLRKTFCAGKGSFATLEARDLKEKTSIISKFFKEVKNHPLKTEFISTPLEKYVNAINSIDVEKAAVMTDLFSSFAKLNKSTLFSGFGSSVDKFVMACRGFMGSVNKFSTNSNNNDKTEIEQVEVESKSGDKENGINISNTTQLAEAIAEAMRNLNIKISPNMIDVNLVADSTSGKRVTLSILD